MEEHPAQAPHEPTCDPAAAASKNEDLAAESATRALGEKQSCPDERQERRDAQAENDRLRGQLAWQTAELQECKRGIRYRLGDALVRAARPSLDTLKLPFRLIRLLREGCGRVNDRSAQDTDKDREGLVPTSAERSPAVHVEISAATAFTTVTPELRRRNDLRIGVVCDEFSWRAWQYEADVFTFTPSTWRDTFEEHKPGLLLIESTWSGPGNTWYGQLSHFGQRRELVQHYAVAEIVQWCRAHDVPSVFYNKEDPPNFEVFIEAARLFDFVFTSDANCIPEYRGRLGHDRVFALPFAAQPRIHNPVRTEPRDGSVCFAGTWYAERHASRQREADRILRPALEFGLHIFDRQAGGDDASFRWPDVYKPAIRGGLPYQQMLAAYKQYKVFLNLNCVSDSPTMFSRRIFELLACGTPVISSYSKGIAQLFGDDIVLMSDNKRTTCELLERVLGDSDFRERLALRGMRAVFSAHTYSHRLQQVLDSIGVTRAPIPNETFCFVAAVDGREDVAAAWANYQRQQYRNKRLLLCSRRADAIEGLSRITGGDASVHAAVGASDATWGRAYRDALRTCDEGFCAALHPHHHYGQHYLTDYAHAALYLTEPATGKASFRRQDGDEEIPAGQRGEVYRTVSQVEPWTLCVPLAIARDASQRLESAMSARNWWSGLQRGLGQVYSTDRFNYVQRESAAPPPLV